MGKILLAFLLAFQSGVALAADETKGKAPDVKEEVEMHEKMAKLHQDVAECLKGGKAPQDCRAEMRKNCQGGGPGMCGGFWGGRGHGRWWRNKQEAK